MDTIPEDEVRRLRAVVRALAFLAAGVHCALCVYCLVMQLQTPPASPHRLALYLARPSFAPPDAPFADDLRRAGQHTCAASNTNATGALVLHNATHLQSWLPQTLHVHVDGFLLLAAVCFLSLLAQVFHAYTTFREEALETFRQPCLVRWLECAATAPLHVALVAMCLLVRDVHTLALLAAAQAACVLLGFALEYALVTEDLEDPLEHTLMARSPPALAVPCELRIGTIVCGPSLDERFMCTQAERAARAWHVSFFASCLLNSAVWAVLLIQLLAVEAALCAPAAPATHAWLAQLRVLVYTQGALFYSFALVPALQRLCLWAGQADAAAVLLYGSVAYAVLAVVTKSMLVASYVSFMQLYPYATLGA